MSGDLDLGIKGLNDSGVFVPSAGDRFFTALGLTGFGGGLRFG